ncbi:AAA family ATPase [Methanorbis furvi]|uniref:ATP-binding protein n=1 Tax=Methanorbis furvi TaxID=3028299 RepID=A0AAE4MD31_9EURY|nr:hypothetical protein [Methanocorpusculaceae archaeon Ag1]
MTLTKISLENVTVFQSLDLPLVNGINIFLGENGTGKTHLMKILYSACQATRPDVSFNEKLVRVFKPDNMMIQRIAQRAHGAVTAKITVFSEKANISCTFDRKTKKWDAMVSGEDRWEKQMGDLTSTFIPAKEILSNAWNLEAAVAKNNVDFDATYVDIIASAKVDISRGKDPASRKKYLEILQKITSGKVFVDNEKFYLMSGNNKLEFALVAEGIRKIALLWQLIKNGTLEHGSVLFWDEPEANINPKYIPVLVDLLLQLQKDGVQVFISTHDYLLAKYFEVKIQPGNEVIYHSLYFQDENAKKLVLCESRSVFGELTHNPIAAAYDQLLDEVFAKEWSCQE